MYVGLLVGDVEEVDAWEVWVRGRRAHGCGVDDVGWAGEWAGQAGEWVMDDGGEEGNAWPL